MKRREFIAGLGAAAWPLAARAQQADRVRRIGLLMRAEDEDDEIRNLQLFRQELQKSGWIEGSNIRFDIRSHRGDQNRAGNGAAELVQLKPDILVAGGALSLATLARETQTIPIVFRGVSDPVGQGFVASLARPGGMITGFTAFEFSQARKWLEALKEIAPGVARVALIYAPDNPNSEAYLRSIEGVGASFAVRTVRVPVRNGADIESALATFVREGGGGLIVLPAGIYSGSNRKLLIELAARYRLPAVYSSQPFTADGGLMSYSIDFNRQWQQAAEYVNRILRGEKPAGLPVQQPTKFELVVNARTARALGLTIPETLLATADEVIQ
jgi:putative tryptophan/tyrosine transport system substrate-binding protein